MKIKKVMTLLVLTTLLMALIPIMPVSAEDPEEGTYLVATSETPNDGTEDRIVITMPAGFTLSELETISWEAWTVYGYPAHVDIYLLMGESLNAEPNMHPTDWFPNLQDYDEWLDTLEWDATTGNDIITQTNTVVWVNSQGGGPGDATHGTLAQFIAGTETVVGDSVDIDGTSVVLRLEIEVDNWKLDTEAYIKNIVVTGSGGTVIDADVKVERILTLVQSDGGTISADPVGPYYQHLGWGDLVTVSYAASTDYVFDRWILDGELAGSDELLSIEMIEAHEVEAVFVLLPQVVSISVTSSVTFDAVAGRELNPGNPIFVDNTGNVPVSITASIPGTEDGDIFFQMYLELATSSQPWDFGSLAVDSDPLEIATNLNLDGVTMPGSYTSTLVFEATPQQP